MSSAVEAVAKKYVKGPNITEGALNRIEAAIRAYDPCLSCSTHAIGKMPIEVVFVDRHGIEIGRGRRD
jgi:NAD-reducing hydrogenase large subunit